MACKCKDKAQSLQSQFLSEGTDSPTATISLEQSHLLRSTLTQKTVNVIGGAFIEVYLSDLAEWIRRGLIGVTFANAEEEAVFLWQYPTITQAMYA